MSIDPVSTAEKVGYSQTQSGSLQSVRLELVCRLGLQSLTVIAI